MPYERPKTRNGIREGLETRYDKDSRTTLIALCGETIGRLVTYGKKDVLSPSKTGFRPTVYSARVNVYGIRLDVEASSATSVLNALATKLNQAFRASPKCPTSTSEAHDQRPAGEAVMGSSSPKP